jgi:hypothetical protein
MFENNKNSAPVEFGARILSCFVNGKDEPKLSLSFRVVSRIIDGKVVSDPEVLPEQPRFKADLSLYKGNDPVKDKRAYVKKINSLRQCWGLPIIQTEGSKRILETTRVDFMSLKEKKAVPVVLMVFRVNPVTMIETIHGKSYRFNWGNGVTFVPWASELLNPANPQGELF